MDWKARGTKEGQACKQWALRHPVTDNNVLASQPLVYCKKTGAAPIWAALLLFLLFHLPEQLYQSCSYKWQLWRCWHQDVSAVGKDDRWGKSCLQFQRLHLFFKNWSLRIPKISIILRSVNLETRFSLRWFNKIPYDYICYWACSFQPMIRKIVQKLVNSESSSSCLKSVKSSKTLTRALMDTFRILLNVIWPFSHSDDHLEAPSTFTGLFTIFLMSGCGTGLIIGWLRFVTGWYNCRLSTLRRWSKHKETEKFP